MCSRNLLYVIFLYFYHYLLSDPGNQQVLIQLLEDFSRNQYVQQWISGNSFTITYKYQSKNIWLFQHQTQVTLHVLIMNYTQKILGYKFFVWRFVTFLQIYFQIQYLLEPRLSRYIKRKTLRNDNTGNFYCKECLIISHFICVLLPPINIFKLLMIDFIIGRWCDIACAEGRYM